MSVGKVCDAGNIVIFDDYGGRIRNKITGKTTWFERKNGIYVLSAWTKAPAEQHRQHEDGEEGAFSEAGLSASVRPTETCAGSCCLAGGGIERLRVKG